MLAPYAFAGLLAAVLGVLISRYHLSDADKLYLTIIQGLASFSGAWVARILVSRANSLTVYRAALALIVFAFLSQSLFGFNLIAGFAVFSFGMGLLNPVMNVIALARGEGRLNQLTAVYSCGLALSPVASIFLGAANPKGYWTFLGVIGLSVLAGSHRSSGGPPRREPEIAERLSAWRPSLNVWSMVVYQIADAIVLRFLMVQASARGLNGFDAAACFSTYVSGIATGRLLASRSKRLLRFHREKGWVSAAATVQATYFMVHGEGMAQAIAGAFLAGFLAGPAYSAILSHARDHDELMLIQAAGTTAPLVCAMAVIRVAPASLPLITPVLWLLFSALQLFGCRTSVPNRK
jgi:hypothetical protein